MDYFVQTAFKCPTLAECYQTAAFDGVNRLGAGRDSMIGVLSLVACSPRLRRQFRQPDATGTQT